MKKNHIIPVTGLAIVLILLPACNKVNEMIAGAIQNKKDKGFRLKEINNGENGGYFFYYNTTGAVDSVREVSFTNISAFRVSYKNDRIDSVGFFYNGQLISSNRNYIYDNKGRIMQWTSFYYPCECFTNIPRDITYDHKDRITTIKAGFDYPIFNDSFAYDHHNNVVSWTKNNYTDTVTSYFVYDDHLNPLYYIDNLPAIVESLFPFWSMLSQHNSVEIAADGSIINPNEYDSYGRLVRRTAGGGNLTYTYY